MDNRKTYRILPPATLLNPTPVVLVSCAEKRQSRTPEHDHAGLDRNSKL